ncbi:hypothetical protein ABIC09_001954 [Bradyrhizobium sp. S3.12.5]|uniref:hypothetical protein n=1 Tax=Bradyrhizobium sp. S3.12.5 TaxID=3156386 RepID=UPI003397CD7C
MSSKFAALVLLVVVSIVGIEPAQAETIRVPWPIWILIEGWYLLAWGVGELWALILASFNAFWAFLLFVVFVPLPRLTLGIVVTLGGAFLPDNIFSKARAAGKEGGKKAGGKVSQAGTGAIEVSAHKVSMKGAPRYAVCLIGIMIVASSLWQFSAK